MTGAFIVDAVRSPIGRRNGTLASLRADELAGQVLNALVERSGFDPGEVEEPGIVRVGDEVTPL